MDTKQNFRIALLIALKSKGLLTDQESQELQAWIDADPKNQQLVMELCDQHAYYSYIQELNKYNSQAKWELTNRKIMAERRRNRLLLRLKYGAAVAVIAIIATLGFVLVDWNARPKASLTRDTSLAAIEKAVLTLDNGRSVTLNPDSVFTLNLDNSTVTNADASLSYSKSTTGDQQQYNTITTPKGCEYKIELSDGTRVHLNSGSSLRFPVSFGTGIREVYTTGELFFEVAHDNKRPFHVHNSDVTVRVLGTTFNISGYTDQRVITTLLEGSVQVGRGTTKVVITPGQSALCEKSNREITVCQADPEMATAWRRGKFMFKDQRLEDVMRVMQQFYDIDVHFESDECRRINLGANISRYRDFTEVANILQATRLFNIKVEGKIVTISSSGE